jgi:hypothetical protein
MKRKNIPVIALWALVGSLVLMWQSASAQTGDTLFVPLLMTENHDTTENPRSTSLELIEESLARGEIDAETALVYQVYALFADPRLPATYQGDDRAGLDHGILRAVAAQFPTLSSETLDILSPFFMPPAYQGSWHDQYETQPLHVASQPQTPAACDGEPGAYFVKEGWRCLGAGNGKVKVWWRAAMPGAEQKAGVIASAIDNDVWPKLTDLMGREPLNDKGPHDFVNLDGEKTGWADGGDGRLDIYLVDPPVRASATTINYPPGCDQRPSFIVISPSIPTKDLPSVVAHEFMHAIQFSYDLAKECYEYEWLHEATAQWAMDHVYPDDNVEQGSWAKAFFRFSVDSPLESGFGYEAYPFFLYLARTHRPQLIKNILELTTQFDSLEAIERALADLGGLQEVWPRFALTNWNQLPVDNYQRWDKLTEGAVTVGTANGNDPNRVERVNLSGKEEGEYKLEMDVPHLATKYYHFSFEGPDTRSVAFHNAFNFFHGLEPAVKVQALVKLAGQEWVVEDWTELDSKAYCRDLRSERLEELVIIISNSEWQDRGHVLNPPTAPRLVVTDIGCWRWTGEATGAYAGSDFTVTTKTSATFERHLFENVPPGMTAQIYYLVDGNMEIRISGANKYGCTAEGGPMVVPLQNLSGELSVYNYSLEGLHHRSYFGLGDADDFKLPVTVTCEHGSYTREWVSATWLFTASPAPLFGSDGATMEGASTVVVTQDGRTGTHTWRFKAETEP